MVLEKTLESPLDCKANFFQKGYGGRKGGAVVEEEHAGLLGGPPWRGHGNPLQYSYLENPRDRGAWWAAVYGVAQSWTRLK